MARMSFNVSVVVVQDGMRKLVEDVRQPVSKAVSFYNRSHASTAPAKSFNAFEYSDKNLDKAGLASAKPDPAKQAQQNPYHGGQMGPVQGIPMGSSIQGSSMQGGMMHGQQRMHIPLGSSMGGLPASYVNQNFHPNVDAMYRSGYASGYPANSIEPSMGSIYRSGGAELRQSFSDRDMLA